MPPGERAIAGVADSKKLAPAERERLAALIRSRALSVALGAASVSEIARLNIYHATVLAMRRAISRLAATPQAILIDGRPLPTLGITHRAVVRGDDRCYSIACASIVAKVARDRLMSRLGDRHLAYGWRENAGYGTPRHCRALVAHGMTRHHRVAFCETVLGQR